MYPGGRLKTASNLPARAIVRAALPLQLKSIVPDLSEMKPEVLVVRELQAVVNVGPVGLEVSPEAGTKVTISNRDRAMRSSPAFLPVIVPWRKRFIKANTQSDISPC